MITDEGKINALLNVFDFDRSAETIVKRNIHPLFFRNVELADELFFS